MKVRNLFKNIPVSRIIMMFIIAIFAIILILLHNNIIKLPESDKTHQYFYASVETYDYSEKSGFYFDTFVEIKLYHPHDGSISSKEKAYYGQVLNEIFEMYREYENLFSKTIASSDISRLNASKTITANEATYDIIKKSIYYSELTDGAFDITTGGITEGFSIADKTIYDAETTEKLLKGVSYKKIILGDNYKISLDDSTTSVDLGAIAKGYITDKTAEYIKSKDIVNFIINLGGNVYAAGNKNPNSDTYTLGIQKPFESTGVSLVKVQIKDKSVVTSGIYQRYFIKEDRLYHHIFSPFTGYPVENNLYSVTIIGDSSTDCDALSTAVFVMGDIKGMELINSIPDVYCVMIDDNNNIMLSDGLVNDNGTIKLR